MNSNVRVFGRVVRTFEKKVKHKKKGFRHNHSELLKRTRENR